MKDETVDGPMTNPSADNRPELAELRAKDAERRFDDLLARLPFGNARMTEGDVTLAWRDDEPDEDAPFAEPQVVTRITLKRVDGTRAEVDRFKKGYRIGSWAEADETLREWATTVPEGTTQRVAYVVEVADGARFYGTLPMAPRNDPLRSWVIKDNRLDPMYLRAT